jgi:hypothetical protein
MFAPFDPTTLDLTAPVDLTQNSARKVLLQTRSPAQSSIPHERMAASRTAVSLQAKPSGVRADKGRRSKPATRKLLQVHVQLDNLARFGRELEHDARPAAQDLAQQLSAQWRAALD